MMMAAGARTVVVVILSTMRMLVFVVVAHQGGLRAAVLALDRAPGVPSSRGWTQRNRATGQLWLGDGDAHLLRRFCARTALLPILAPRLLQDLH